MSDIIERLRKVPLSAQPIRELEDQRLAAAAEIDRLRAGIAAMREPTEAQLIAARDWSYHKYGKPIGNSAARGCWQAMFDALQNS